MSGRVVASALVEELVVARGTERDMIEESILVVDCEGRIMIASVCSGAVNRE